MRTSVPPQGLLLLIPSLQPGHPVRMWVRAPRATPAALQPVRGEERGLRTGNGGQRKRTVGEMPAVRNFQLVIQQYRMSRSRSRSSADCEVNSAVPNTRLNSAMGFSVY